MRENDYLSSHGPLRGEGGVLVKILFWSDIGSKFSVILPTFYRIEKSCSIGPQLPDLLGLVRALGVILGHLERFDKERVKKCQQKYKKTYFNKLLTIEYDTWNIPEGEQKVFCHLTS